MAKMGIKFDGFDAVIARLSKIGADTKEITTRAIKESHKLVTKNAEQAIAPHRKTGRTQKSLQQTPNVKWAGDRAECDVGFDIYGGGLPSIFLMYGTPRMRKNQKLYNSIYGKATHNEVIELQERIFFGELAKHGG